MKTGNPSKENRANDPSTSSPTPNPHMDIIKSLAKGSAMGATEVAINHSLTRITHDHTVILIAHRLSTVRNADTIFVMSEGNIVESGTHDQLVARNGIYAGLWKVQTGEA